jgi:hypothetical protein
MASNRYNCIAWVLEVANQWCWPDARSFWPIEKREVTVACFTESFASFGYEPCTHARAETGYSKIAMYVAQDRPTHAARIESDAIWSSKLGRAELIEHEPQALNSIAYGLPVHFFRRRA